MPFEIPADLHPHCAPIAWLLGTWAGNGHGDYPTIEPFHFGQEVKFLHDGRPFFHYVSRSWLIDESGERLRDSAIETGFLRAQPEGAVELLLTHASGISEIWYGQAEGGKISLQTDAVVRTATAKEVTAGTRLYGNVDGDLLYAYDMAAVGQPLTPHLWARLARQ